MYGANQRSRYLVLSQDDAKSALEHMRFKRWKGRRIFVGCHFIDSTPIVRALKIS